MVALKYSSSHISCWHIIRLYIGSTLRFGLSWEGSKLGLETILIIESIFIIPINGGNHKELHKLPKTHPRRDPGGPGVAAHPLLNLGAASVWLLPCNRTEEHSPRRPSPSLAQSVTPCAAPVLVR